VAQALRVMELGLIVPSIYQAYLAIANLLNEFHLGFVDEDEAIIGRIRNHNQVVLQS
jgi:hypothetical protein